MTKDRRLTELAERLREKAYTLDGMALAQHREQNGITSYAEAKRLEGKAEGVRLAVSFVEELIRSES